MNPDDASNLEEHVTRERRGDAAPRRSAVVPLQILDLAESSDPLAPGDSVGQHRVLRRIGAGGMGVVFEAEHRPTGRRVALKVMREGTRATPREFRWFRREIRALALIQHEGIATLYDVGTTEGGLPYLTMELVDGIGLDRFAAGRQPDPSTSLALMVAVARAVAAAHRRGVVHLDLKPSNVLIDSAGTPKVLDFGLARIANADEKFDSVASLARPMVGTLPFMAPEQVLGDVATIDTRTDVYALGVMLYQLLTDTLPFEVQTSRPYEAIRAIVETEPRAPSRVVAGLCADIDAIIACSMSKDPERRYPSANALADDLERWLAGQPIEARTPTLWYRFERFVQRRRRLALGIGLATAAVVIAWLATIAAVVSAHRAEGAASLQAQKASTALQLLTDLFAQASPDAMGHDVTLREFVEHNADYIASLEASGDSDPEVLASLHAATGRAFQSLGMLDRAQDQLSRALGMRRGFDDPAALATSLRDLGFCLHADTELARAEALLREALSLRLQLFEPHDPAVLQSREELATLLGARGQVREARGLIDDNVAAARMVVDSDPLCLAVQLTELGEFCFETSGYATAAEALSEARSLFARQDVDDPAAELRMLRLLGQAHTQLLEFERADEVLSEAMRLAEANLEPVDLQLANLHGQLARLRSRAGDCAAALEHYQSALQIRRTRLGESAGATFASRLSVAVARVAADPSHDGVPELGQLLADSSRELGDQHSLCGEIAAALGSAQIRNGDTAGARRVLRGFGDVAERDELTIQCRARLLAARAQLDLATAAPTAVASARELADFVEKWLGRERYEWPSALRTLGVALSAAGDYAAAIDVATRQIEDHQSKGRPREASLVRARRAIYSIRDGQVEAGTAAFHGALAQLAPDDPARARLTDEFTAVCRR